jgi:hypothetical protein
MNRMNSVRTALAAALVSVVASAQALSGAYSIDGTLPTGGGNYNSFVDASAAIYASGVAGPVDFFVVPGTYAGFSMLGAYTGMNAANPVRFIGSAGTVFLTGVAAGAVHTIRLGSSSTVGSGPANVTLSGLDCSGAPSGSGIMVAGGANVVVEFCSVSASGAGISLVGTSGSVVQDCFVTGTANTPGTPGSTSYSGAISAYLNSDNVTIRRNRVVSCTGNGIFVGTSGDTTACDAPIVINNFIADAPGLGSYPGALCLRRCPNAICSNNSISVSAGSIFPGLHLMVLSSTTVTHMEPLEVSNNLVQHLGSGPCVALNSFSQANPMSPTVLDFNAYDPVGGGPVGGVNLTSSTGMTGFVYYATLAAWQAVASPNLVGQELNTLVGAASYTSPTDLHVLPSTVGFQNGSVVAVVTDDIDGGIRIVPPTRGADEPVPTGIFPNFTGAPLFGPAPLTVNFTDTTYTSDPGGVITWNWDFNSDNVVDSTLQNPSFTYLVPGTYTVTLSVADVLNGSAQKVRLNYIVVGQYVFDVQTTGGGTGDLVINAIPHIGVPNAVTGYLLISFTPATAVGAGPFFGLTPDNFTWPILFTAPVGGDLLHWAYLPGFFPDVPLILPPGTLSFLAGLTADFVQLDLTSAFTLANVSPVERVTF